jgi:hypothetical protein
VDTYQAYNAWEGVTLSVQQHGQIRAYKVTFNRPYDDNYGAGQFFTYEYNMVVKRRRNNISYVTDVDMHENLTFAVAQWGSDSRPQRVLVVPDAHQRAGGPGCGVGLGRSSTTCIVKFGSSRARGEVSPTVPWSAKSYTIDPVYLAHDPSQYYLVTAEPGAITRRIYLKMRSSP